MRSRGSAKSIAVKSVNTIVNPIMNAAVNRGANVLMNQEII